MSWFSTIVIAVLTAALAAIGATVVASLATSWYRMSSFEGASGYFVVVTGIGGLLGGLLLGVVVARWVAVSSQPSAWLALGIALGSVLVATGIAAGVCRWFADVAPTLAGEELLLQVELRWPATQKISPAVGAGDHEIVLAALVTDM